MKYKKTALFACASIAAGAFAYQQNHTLQVEHITCVNKQLPKALKGLKIVHLSDLHNASFGKHQKKLMKEIIKLQPDMIVITGDICDRRHLSIRSLRPIEELINQLVLLADVYFVTGNHEADSLLLPNLLEMLKHAGVHVLRNEVALLEYHNQPFALVGIDDIQFFQNDQKTFYEMLTSLKEQSKHLFSMLLVHRPEMFYMYEKVGYDIICSGHAHGGQIKINKRNGIFAPGQGFFPKYCSGVYEKNNASMIVSRGLGNSGHVLRLNNRPHIVSITLC